MHSVCPLVGIGAPQPPLPLASVPPPPEPKGGGGGTLYVLSSACEGVEESHFGKFVKKLSTSVIYWNIPYFLIHIMKVHVNPKAFPHIITLLYRP